MHHYCDGKERTEKKKEIWRSQTDMKSVKSSRGLPCLPLM